MTKDLPDFWAARQTDIVAQSVGNLLVDIAAQTIDKLKVDITAQTIAKLAIDIASQTLGNLLVDIKAQTLANLKVDITAQTLAKLAIDIAAQTLANLKVDITAQTLAKLAVDITTQTLSALKINITTQDLAQLVISINAQAVGIYLQPEWAAKTAVDKNFFATLDNAAYGAGAVVSYTVTAGKKLYITQLSGSGHGYDAADRDLNQPMTLHLQNYTDSLWLVELGGFGGCGIVLPKPIAFAADKNMRAYAVRAGNHAMNMRVACQGYEV